MKWLKQLQSLHTKLVIVYVLLIIIGMQIIGLYFTNSLEKELLDNFKKNITQYAKQLDCLVVAMMIWSLSIKRISPISWRFAYSFKRSWISF